MSDAVTAQAYWYDDEKLYVARDLRTPTGGMWCQHARWRRGRVQWCRHPEGGICKPFEGPPEVAAGLIAGAWRMR